MEVSQRHSPETPASHGPSRTARSLWGPSSQDTCPGPAGARSDGPGGPLAALSRPLSHAKAATAPLATPSHPIPTPSPRAGARAQARGCPFFRPDCVGFDLYFNGRRLPYKRPPRAGGGGSKPLRPGQKQRPLGDGATRWAAGAPPNPRREKRAQHLPGRLRGGSLRPGGGFPSGRPTRAGSALRPGTGRRPEAPQSQIYGLGDALPCPHGPVTRNRKWMGAERTLICAPRRPRAPAGRPGTARRGTEVWSPRAVRSEPRAGGFFPDSGSGPRAGEGARPSPGPALRDPPAPRRIPGSSSAPQSHPLGGPGPTGAPTCPPRALGSPTPGSASAQSPGPRRVEPAWGAQGRTGPAPLPAAGSP